MSYWVHLLSLISRILLSLSVLYAACACSFIPALKNQICWFYRVNKFFVNQRNLRSLNNCVHCIEDLLIPFTKLTGWNSFCSRRQYYYSIIKFHLVHRIYLTMQIWLISGTLWYDIQYTVDTSIIYSLYCSLRFLSFLESLLQWPIKIKNNQTALLKCLF